MLFVAAVQVFVTYELLHGVAADTTTSGFGSQTNSDFTARSITAQLIVLAVTTLATVLLTGMITTVAGQAVLGRPMGIRDAWEGSRPLLLRLFGATLLIAVIVILAAAIAAIPGVIVIIAGATGFGVFLLVVGVFVAVVWVAVLLVMTTPALILEKLTVVAALRRSRRLVTSSWWRTLGIVLLAQIIATVIAGIVAVPFAIAGGIGTVLSGNPSDQYHFVPLLLTGIGTFLGGTLVRPFSAGVMALLYIDRRMRSEALDLTLQQAAANRTS
jgi:hypothetical protein